MISREQLKVWRMGANLSQRQVAQALGITQGAMCSWENRASVPRPKLYRKICKLYRCSMVELIDVIDPPRRRRANENPDEWSD